MGFRRPGLREGLGPETIASAWKSAIPDCLQDDTRLRAKAQQVPARRRDAKILRNPLPYLLAFLCISASLRQLCCAFASRSYSYANTSRMVSRTAPRAGPRLAATASTNKMKNQAMAAGMA